MNAQIKPVEPTKNLSYWELSHLLETTAKAIKDLPNSVIRNLEYVEQEAYGHIEDTIKAVNNRLAELQTALVESDESLEKAVDEHYRSTVRRIYDLNQKLMELPKIENAMQLPYNVKEIIEIADRFAHLSDEQWRRVIELAKALAGK